MHPMFNAALFTIAKCWKQTKCPSVDDWIKKLWYIYIMEYQAAGKKKGGGAPTFYYSIGGPGDYYAK